MAYSWTATSYIKTNANTNYFMSNSTIEVPFTLTLNGLDFSTQSIPYIYYEVPYVHKLLPTHGLLRGGTEIG